MKELWMYESYVSEVTQLFYVIILGVEPGLVNRDCMFERMNEGMNLIKFQKQFWKVTPCQT